MSKKEIVMKQDSKQIHLYINNDTCYLIDIEKKDITKEFLIWLKKQEVNTK